MKRPLFHVSPQDSKQPDGSDDVWVEELLEQQLKFDVNSLDVEALKFDSDPKMVELWGIVKSMLQLDPNNRTNSWDLLPKLKDLFGPCKFCSK